MSYGLPWLGNPNPVGPVSCMDACLLSRTARTKTELAQTLTQAEGSELAGRGTPSCLQATPSSLQPSGIFLSAIDCPLSEIVKNTQYS